MAPMTAPSRPAERFPALRRRLASLGARFGPVAGVLAVSLLCTAWAWHQTQEWARGRDEARFDQEVEATRATLIERLRRYESVLQGAQGLLAASQSVEPGEWWTFVDGLDIEQDYPGLDGV